MNLIYATGQDATLTYASSGMYTLSCDNASFSATGQTAGLLRGLQALL